MKKLNRFSIILIAVIMAFFMSEEAYAENGTVLPKYYKEMIEGIDGLICIYDCSWSMDNTFTYEKELIKYNLSETEFEKNFNLETSALWSELDRKSVV